MERLRHLLTVFNDLRSPGQLTDAMAELGCIYAELIQTHLVPRDEMLCELAETGRQNTGSSRTQAIADHSYLTLCIQAAGMYSKRQRLLLRPAPEIQAPQWTMRTSTQAAGQAEPTVTTEALPKTGSVTVTKWDEDYAEQGQRYAFFVSELLVNLQTTDPPKPLTVDELEPEVARALAKYGKTQRVTAQTVADLIKESGKQTSRSQVQNTNAWKYYVEQTGKKRNPAATLTNTDRVLKPMLSSDTQIQGSNGRRSKKPVERSDD